jgi:hypothetical protein
MKNEISKRAGMRPLFFNAKAQRRKSAKKIATRTGSQKYPSFDDRILPAACFPAKQLLLGGFVPLRLCVEFCQQDYSLSRFETPEALPNVIRRYGRLEICATS